MENTTLNNSDFENCKNMIWKNVLVRFNMMKRSRPEVEFDDLLSEGYFIYSWCLRNYKDSKNTKFTTYLYMNLRQRLKDYYDFTCKQMNLYEDSVRHINADDRDFVDNIVSKEYDLSTETKSILSDASEQLSYEANEVLKYILSRDWETKMRKNMPSNAQICKKFGYSADIVESVMFEIKQFWMNRKVA